jgi:hypothetical protein
MYSWVVPTPHLASPTFVAHSSEDSVSAAVITGLAVLCTEEAPNVLVE